MSRASTVVTIALACLVMNTANADCVVLLHGLLRSSAAMDKLAVALSERDYRVANIDYPSRHKTIEELAPEAVEAGLEECADEQPIHFVGHSLGGILVRYYLSENSLPTLGRVVMLGSPNHGSQVIDNLGEVPGFRMLNGPAAAQLGTDENSVPLSLGPVDYEVGIIAGTRTINVILSQYLPNPDDGKVSLESAKVEGMTDFLAVPHSHPFIMKNAGVIAQTIHFLEHGKFLRETE